VTLIVYASDLPKLVALMLLIQMCSLQLLRSTALIHLICKITCMVADHLICWGGLFCRKLLHQDVPDPKAHFRLIDICGQQTCWRFVLAVCASGPGSRQGSIYGACMMVS
jgi:hypothetical protein